MDEKERRDQADATFQPNIDRQDSPRRRKDKRGNLKCEELFQDSLKKQKTEEANMVQELQAYQKQLRSSAQDSNKPQWNTYNKKPIAMFGETFSPESNQEGDFRQGTGFFGGSLKNGMGMSGRQSNERMTEVSAAASNVIQYEEQKYVVQYDEDGNEIEDDQRSEDGQLEEMEE